MSLRGPPEGKRKNPGKGGDPTTEPEVFFKVSGVIRQETQEFAFQQLLLVFLSPTEELHLKEIRVDRNNLEPSALRIKENWLIKFRGFLNSKTQTMGSMQSDTYHVHFSITEFTSRCS